MPQTPTDEQPLSQNLPTVYSPTPSLPTIVSPSSAASPADGKGYLEVYKVPMRNIDAQGSVPTFTTASLISSLTEDASIPFYYSPSYPRVLSPATSSMDYQLPSDILPPSTFILSRPSFRVHQKPAHSISRLPSLKRNLSNRSSNAASHGSCKFLVDLINTF